MIRLRVFIFEDKILETRYERNYDDANIVVPFEENEVDSKHIDECSERLRKSNGWFQRRKKINELICDEKNDSDDDEMALTENNDIIKNTIHKNAEEGTVEVSEKMRYFLFCL